ncbi:hypothetical protein M9H77_27215 [Catharanthus roseus]|uniref:Uncharacterized protein n=1 Tax=Catharanthus roseus TaxID=4058 RepID=A0ACC0ABU4_CATRO|nr:hypothetical protein M9H77_27215 [Catharanthus roseus]
MPNSGCAASRRLKKANRPRRAAAEAANKKKREKQQLNTNSQGEGIDFKRKRNDCTGNEESRGIKWKSHKWAAQVARPGLARHLLTQSNGQVLFSCGLSHHWVKDKLENENIGMTHGPKSRHSPPQTIFSTFV